MPLEIDLTIQMIFTSFIVCISISEKLTKIELNDDVFMLLRPNIG